MTAPPLPPAGSKPKDSHPRSQHGSSRARRGARLRAAGATIGAAWLMAGALAACGSSGSSGSSGQTGGGSIVSGIKQTGSGLTEPTDPKGTRIKGGIITFAEAPQTTPNYIFPMISTAYCISANNSQFSDLIYRPLYWYGNDYSPTVDYDYSVGEAPVWSDGDRTVTIKLKDWKWSDGETVSSRDVEFYINLYKSDPAANYCGYVPKMFPDNVVSMSLPNSSTIALHLDKAYDPEWFLYNELSQITPIPLAWDRTSLSQAAPTSDNGQLPDATHAGALAVYKFLNTQSLDLSTWASSPIWSVADGPWKLQSFTADGEATFVPNPDYSSSPKPSVSKFIELPYTSDSAAFTEFRSGGPSAVTVGYVPAQDLPEAAAVKAEGYIDNQGSMYAFNSLALNFNNPKVGPIFRQLYFRQAFQHLVDQNGWINAFLGKAAVANYSPIPAAPPSTLVSADTGGDLYPFSTAQAASVLTAHGWKVVPNGTTTCVKPGTGNGECGAGISRGEAIAFNLDYASGSTALTSEMNDLGAQAQKVGITLTITQHPYDDVVAADATCTAKQPACKWTAENWGTGWVYGPDFLPTGEMLFQPGAASNASQYDDPYATRLINETISAPASQEAKVLSEYAKYLAQQLPVVYTPAQIGIYLPSAGTLVSGKLGGWSANAFAILNPEAWYLVK